MNGFRSNSPQSAIDNWGKKVDPKFPADPQDYQGKARALVYEYVKTRLEKTDVWALNDFSVEKVYVVWFAKALKNWKALVSTMLTDGMYYEVTYNGERAETYIDAYKKWDNVCVPDEDVMDKYEQGTARISMPKTKGQGVQIGDGNAQTNTWG